VDEARRVLDDALRVSPDSSELLGFLGAFYMRLGEKQKAEETLKKAREKTQDPARAELQLAGFYATEQNWLEAEKHYKAACAAAADSSMRFISFSALGDFYMRRGRLDESVKQYDEALMVFHNHPEALVRKAELHLRLNNVDEARKAIESLKMRGRRDVYHVQALQLDGQRLLAENQPDEAVEQIEAALSSMRDADIKVDPTSVFLVLGRAQLMRGDYPAARQALLDAHAASPNSPLVVMELARVLLIMREYDQVISLLDIPRKSYDALLYTGAALMARGKPEDVKAAKTQLLTARSLDASDPRAAFQLGQLAMITRNSDEAVKYFDEVARAGGPTYKVHGLLYKARAYETDNRLSQAERVYLDAEQEMPEVTRIRLEHAAFLTRKNRFDDAEKVLLDRMNGLPEDSPERKEFENTLSAFYMGAGKTDKALSWLKLRAQRDPKDLRTRQTLVSFCLARNQKDEAVKYINEIKALQKPGSPAVLMLDGQVLVTEQKFKEALAKFLEAEKSQPKNIELMYYLGYCYLRTGGAGALEKARGYLEKVSGQRPANAWARRALAEIHYGLGDLEEAKKLAEEATARGEGSVAMDIIIGAVGTRTGEPEQGEAYWRAFVKEYPSVANGFIYLADILWRQEKRDEAVEAMRKAYELDAKSFPTTYSLTNMHVQRKELDKAIAVANDALGEKRDSLPTLGLLARLYEMVPNPSEAAKTYARISQVDPSNPLPAVARAEKALAGGDLAAAEGGFREALRLRPENDAVRARLLEVLMRRGKSSDALALLDSQLAKKPKDVALTVTKARVLSAAGRPDEAVRLMREAVRLAREAGVEKQNSLLHYELGQMYMQMGRLAEARQSLETARDLNPQAINPRLKLVQIAVVQARPADARAECMRIIQIGPNLDAYIVLGDLARDDNDLKGARTHYERAVKQFPDSTDARRRVASLLLAEQKTDEALAELRKVLDMEKHSPEAIASLVGVLIQKQRFDDAISLCQNELDKTKDQASVYLFMGDTEAARRRYAKARQYYDMALDKAGDRPGVYLAKAETYRQDNNTSGAIGEAEQAIKAGPAFEPAYVFLENLYRTGKNEARQAENYARWVKALPESVVAVNNYAWFLSETRKEPDAALKMIDAFRTRMTSAGRSFPYGGELDDTEGQAHFRKGDYRRAAQLFNRSLETRGDSAKTWERLRVTLVNLRDRARDMNDETAAQRFEADIQRAFAKARELSPRNFDMQVQLAEMRLGEGKLDEAIRTYENALTIREDQLVRQRLAEVLIRDERTEDARKHVTELIKTDPDNSMNLILEGMLLSRMDRHDKALAMFEEVVRRFPRDEMGHYMLAGEHLTLNQLDKAYVELDKVIALKPGFSGARLLKARLLAAEKKMDQAVAECKSLVEADPMNFEGAFALGNLYLSQNKITEAEGVFRSVVKKWPDSIWARERLAETCRRGNRMGEALLQYEDGRRRNPRSLMLLRGMSMILQAQGRTDRAIREYSNFLENDPTSLEASLELATLYGRQQQYGDAERALKAAVKLARTSPDVHAVLVNFYVQRGMFLEARGAAQRMMQDVTTKEGKAMAQTLIAHSHEVEGNFDEAVKQYRRLISEDPKNVAAVNNLAWLLATRRNDPDAAIRLAEPLLKDYPGFAELFDTVGWAYRLKNDFAKAEPLLGKAAALKGTEKPVLLYHLGDVLFQSGKTEEARKVLELATRTPFSEYDKAVEILNKIKRPSADKTKTESPRR
jgi:tetratricopeptide (TPR) repeat protein